MYLRRGHKQLLQLCQACGERRKGLTRLSNTLRLVPMPLLYSTDAVNPTIVAIHGPSGYCQQKWTDDGCACGRCDRPTIGHRGQGGHGHIELDAQ